MIDYFAVQTALDAVGSVTPPAECHGIAVGLMCTARSFAPELWFDHLFGAGYELTEHTVHCAQLLRDMAIEIDRQLKSEAFELEIFLPESGSLKERVAALADWCQGFLLGISLAQIGDLDSLPVDSREFVQDLSKIARADVDVGDDGEEGEQAYVELVEYVRVGVLMFRDDVLSGERV